MKYDNYMKVTKVLKKIQYYLQLETDPLFYTLPQINVLNSVTQNFGRSVANGSEMFPIYSAIL